MKLIAKLAIVLMVVVLGISGLAVVKNSVMGIFSKSYTPTKPSQATYQPPKQMTAPSTTAATQQSVTSQPAQFAAATAPVQSVPLLNPVSLDESKLKPGMLLEIHSVSDGEGDMLTAVPVWVGSYHDTSVNEFRASKLGKMILNHNAMLLHFKTYYKAQKDGAYLFGSATGDSQASSIRVDGTMIREWGGGEGTGNVQLAVGWHEVDIRVFISTKHRWHGRSYQLFVKTPSDSQIKKLQTTELMHYTDKVAKEIDTAKVGAAVPVEPPKPIVVKIR